MQITRTRLQAPGTVSPMALSSWAFAAAVWRGFIRDDPHPHRSSVVIISILPHLARRVSTTRVER
jgi:hypothetical protein